MDMIELEKKISEIEEVLGIDDLTTKTSIPSQIEALQSKLRDDCKANLLMSIPIQKLEHLSKIATETSGPYGSLTDKIESVKYAEKLINERAERIKQFSDALEPCLDQELFSKVAALQPELDAEIEKYEKALEDWTKTYGEFQTLVAERSMINQKITEKVLDLQTKINAKAK
ncbi:DyNactin Complex component [Caenorhabditis elegans]|uniref:DyNactin Complex component n=1 Tax=Caenorhabditis elegans TaxID=6239 RepID=Q965K5_CAEEL|nr:DyNactin Complex component [Caenorhabditis elegans]CCD73679.1 DyNactin Complex component [Caenorhabditis elegans]|eukprot:NP_494573.2 DyNactin Complex component [Caenorhabditis elegans]